jgi:site-specific DNA-methyltransferase (adenine-specific)
MVEDDRASILDFWNGPKHGIRHGRAEDLSWLPDNSVDLVLTSPPYWNAVDYAAQSTGSDAWHRGAYSKGYENYDKYLDWWADVCAEVHRVLKPHGVFAFVVGTVRVDGQAIPVPQDLLVRANQGKLSYLEEIVWNKTTGGARRAGLYLQHQSPGYFFPNILAEYIYLLAKTDGARWNPPWRDRTVEGPVVDDIFTREIANNVWHIAPVPPKKDGHPAPYPSEIPHRIISLYSPPGAIVLDPMVGSGTTAHVANALGRIGLGSDIEEGYVEMARSSVQQPFKRRSLHLVARYERVGPGAVGMFKARYSKAASKPRQRKPK